MFLCFIRFLSHDYLVLLNSPTQLVLPEAAIAESAQTPAEELPVTSPLTPLDVLVADVAAPLGIDPIVHIRRFTHGRYLFADRMRRPLFVRIVARVS